MNLNQLTYFKVVYECMNVTKASEQLMVSQPAVSSAVRELERELEVTLFIRKNRGLQATEEGEVLYEQACRLLQQCENAKLIVKAASDKKSAVRIGMAPMTGSVAFPPVYRKLSEQYPEIELEIVENGGPELVKLLERDLLEVALVPDGIYFPGCEKVEILRSRLYFVLNRQHPLAAQESVSLEQMAEIPLAIYPKGYIASENIKRVFDEAGLPMHIFAYTPSYATIRMMVDCNAAGGFLMREICEADPNIRMYPFEQLPEYPVYLIWKRDGYLSRSAKQLIRCCREMQKKNL
jgi:DNA-binding transcriptional LysR family regulator